MKTTILHMLYYSTHANGYSDLVQVYLPDYDDNPIDSYRSDDITREIEPLVMHSAWDRGRSS